MKYRSFECRIDEWGDDQPWVFFLRIPDEDPINSKKYLKDIEQAYCNFGYNGSMKSVRWSTTEITEDQFEHSKIINRESCPIIDLKP